MSFIECQDLRERVDGAPPAQSGEDANPSLPPPLAVNGRFLSQPVTGVQRVAREIVREIDNLVDEGVLKARVVLLCPPDAETEGLSLKAIRLRRVGPFRGAMWEQLALPFHAAGMPLLCLGNTAPVPSLLAGQPVGVMIHDLSYMDFTDAYRLSYRVAHRLMLPVLLRRARLVFCVSRTEERQLRSLAQGIEHRLVVAANGADFPQAASDEEVIIPFEKGFGLYVGAFSHRKNFARVMEVAIRMAREDGQSFVFVGCAPDIMNSPDLLIPADVRHLVHFAGQVDDPLVLSAYYRNARYLLFPSLYEASPLPPVEAAAFGCPVVASNIASIWERCGDGVEYCDPMRIESIIAAVRRVIAGGGPLSRRIERHRLSARRLSWRDQANRVSGAMLGLCPDIAP